MQHQPIQILFGNAVVFLSLKAEYWTEFYPRNTKVEYMSTQREPLPTPWIECNFYSAELVFACSYCFLPQLKNMQFR